MNCRRRLLLTYALVYSLGGLHGSAVACCGVGPLGSKTQFVEQQNIIIWDSKAKEEVFIRKAQFLTNAKDFGFIAPTPTVPKIEEADSGAYKSLEKLKPQPWGIRGCSAEEAGTEAAASAEIVQQVDVAGYRATTLRASNSESIRSWMKANKYASTPGIDKWLDFYVTKRWYVTAFKVLSLEKVAATGTIKLTFKTDRPFNPYYVPAENLPPEEEESRPWKVNLAVFFISDTPVKGVREDKGRWARQEWNAQIPENERAGLATALKVQPELFARLNHLTKFEDHEFPQSSLGDIYFEPDADLGWLGGALGVGLVAGYVGWRRRRIPSPTPAGK